VDLGACTGGATPTTPPRATATATPRTRATATPRTRATATATSRARATATATARPRVTATATTPPASGINPGPGVPAGKGAPYVDVLAWPTIDVNAARNATTHRYYTFGFFQSNGCRAYVGGVIPLTDLWYKDQLNALRAAGGDMIFAFGGAAGIELAQACPDVASLEAAYRSAINTYGIKWMDLDIEGAPLYDMVANDKRNKAIRNLGVKISYTLPVMPEGLTAAGIALLNNAKANGVPVSVVNVMAMDYGTAYCGDMGSYAVQALNSVKSQLAANGIAAQVGVTPMIGVNDVTCEIFQLSDMDQLKAANPAFISFWSLGRDNGGCSGIVSPSCSGISQSTYAFTAKMPH
jgi:hypothetical protein